MTVIGLAHLFTKYVLSSSEFARVRDEIFDQIRRYALFVQWRDGAFFRTVLSSFDALQLLRF